MRWLVVSPYLPHPAIGHGGGICVYHLCRELASSHEVTLLCFQRHGERGLERSLSERGVRVVPVPFRSGADRGLARIPLLADRALRYLRSRLRHRPLMVEKYQRDEMTRALERCLEEWRPDVVQVEYGFLAPYAAHARFFVDAHRGLWHKGAVDGEGRTARVLLNTHESGSLVRLRRLAESRGRAGNARLARELSRWSRLERGFADSADTVLCVTEQDRVLLHALSGAANLRTVPLGVDVDGLPAVTHDPQNPPQLLFVGSFGHPPNEAGARVLVEELMPRVWREQPDAVAEIVGADPPDWLRDIADRQPQRLRVRGFVEDLDPLFESAQVFVAPLFGGGGIKIKILEAMGRGCAVVTTPLGAEGIDDEGTALALGRDVEELARHVLRLMADPGARRDLGQAARRRMQERFGWSAIVRALAGIVEENPTT